MISHVECCDCMDFMKKFPDKYFDLAIVDPPYGIGAASKQSTNKTMRLKIKSGEIHGGEWDSQVPREEYFNELFRVSMNQVIWGGNYFDLPPSKCFFIWDKGESIYGRDFAECEMAWVSFDKCARMIKMFPNQSDRIHPTQKPILLYKWVLEHYAKPGDKILDTHLGSQSSRIAAHQMGFDFWGCEIDQEYFDLGCKRFEKESAQQMLFAANES
jgi:site-specific DNA-methyltransferase (adenine-specific)